jgi:ADP-ribose pyrophosphatase
MDSSSLPQPWTVRSSEYDLKTPWLNVRRDACAFPNGAVEDYYVIERKNTIGVVPVTADGQVVMNWQYRHGIQKTVLEIPVGFIDEGEEALAAAQRELIEETGYAGGEWIHLVQLYPNPGLTTSSYDIFLALGVTQSETPQNDPREQIVNELFSFTELERQIGAGEMPSMWSVSAIELAIRWLRTNNRYPQ